MDGYTDHLRRDCSHRMGRDSLKRSRRREVQKLTINVIDFQKLRDGTYVGEYIGTKDHSRDTKVQASISEGQILDIKIFKGALDKNGNPLKMKGG